LKYCRIYTVTRAVTSIQEVLQCLEVSIDVLPQSDGMVESYMKTVEEHLRKVFASHQRDCAA
jgi:hypothetical protein